MESMHRHLSQIFEGGEKRRERALGRGACGENNMNLHFLVTKEFSRYCGKKVIAVLVSFHHFAGV